MNLRKSIINKFDLSLLQAVHIMVRLMFTDLSISDHVFTAE